MNLNNFVNSALQNMSAECRIRITDFQKAYDCLSEGFKKQGLSGSQTTDTLWGRLSAICPQCGYRISGKDLGDLWVMGSFGFDRVVVYGPGGSDRFGKGNCPNETCSSNEIVLTWEAYSETHKLPWDWSSIAPENDVEFLKSLCPCLPTVFQSLGQRGHDPVVMLVDVEDIRWRGLLGLLHTRYGQPYFSPETVTGQELQIEQHSAGPFYIPPNIDGKELRVGIYGVEREWLVSELCWIRGLPIPFIKQVRKGQTPKGMFTIVYFLKTHLGVRHVSLDGSVCEAPKLSMSDLM